MRIASPSRRRSAATGSSRLAMLAAVTALALAVGGCGSSDDIDGGPIGTGDDGPRVADARFDGEFTIVDVTVDGTPTTGVEQATLDIDAEFGGLTVRPGCNTYFGSFTLQEDGRASFTVTGGTGDDCGQLTDQEATILAALAAVDQWVEVDAGFRFDGLGSSVSVAGPAG